MTDQSAIEARCASLFSAFLSDSGPEGSGLVDLTKLGSVEFMDKVDKSTFDAIKSSIEKLQSKPALVGNTKTRIALEVGPECDVENHWWGFDMLMNENLTNKIAIGTASVATVTGSIVAALTGAGIVAVPLLMPIAGGFAAAIVLKSGEIKIVDNGNGVHFPVSWPQLALVIAGISAGPAGVIAAIIAFIHPVAR